MTIERISIDGEKSITHCAYSFPNAIAVCFESVSFTSCPSLTSLLHRIIPLKQLTKVTFKDTKFPLEKLVDCLESTPQVRTLVLRSIVCSTDDNLLIEQNEKFRRISQTNLIQHITYDDSRTIDKVKLSVALYPRIEHLSVYHDETTRGPILRFLLDRTNRHTSHLCLLCIRQRGMFWLNRLNHLLKSESLLDDDKLNLTDTLKIVFVTLINFESLLVLIAQSRGYIKYQHGPLSD